MNIKPACDHKEYRPRWVFDYIIITDELLDYLAEKFQAQSNSQLTFEQFIGEQIHERMSKR